MGVPRRGGRFAYVKTAEDVLKRIFCLNIVVRGEHVKKRGFSPPSRPEEHVLERAGFQKTDETGFIGNDGARVVPERGKLCVCREKEMFAILARH